MLRRLTTGRLRGKSRESVQGGGREIEGERKMGGRAKKY